MTRLADDQYRQPAPVDNLDYARIRGNLVGATHTLVASIRALDHGAWNHLHSAQPGYNVTTSGANTIVARTETDDTQPERADILNDRALGALTQLRDAAVAVVYATGLVHDVALGWATTRAHPMTPPADPTEWCRSHLAIGQVEPRYRGILCRFCYDFQLMHDRLPPAEILQARHEGKRITNKMVRAALGKKKR